MNIINWIIKQFKQEIESPLACLVCHTKYGGHPPCSDFLKCPVTGQLKVVG